MSSHASLDLSGRIALVTGATGGIGGAIAHTLIAHGARVVLSARNAERLATLSDTLREAGLTPLGTLAYDLQDATAISTALKSFAAEHKRLDILVNAGGQMQDAPLGMISAAAIDQTLQVNVAATLHHMQYAARLMARQGSGSIINIASIVGLVGSANQTLYAASKAAIVGATRSAAKELAPKHIRVNALAPGFIDTALTAHYTPAVRDKVIAGIGMGRAGTAEEVADVALFLASDLARYVTGQVIGVDGGMLL
ncbi:glucose 1-dehydrogenase [Niveibacterium umoris]|uniref:3-oxoacyl-[acyl-carrier protein] reductase n=1 Tax=Niveibacterium umoris TaxID=1193620 RepID=A0A840BJZ2_9RHOO|nr:SDR family NAD(P)-dependent oxidoreductase [Niveibacterium umoris]MBB4011908.1 3-oxoacyl-[acyl-carrier protein] reductase [Niveibacterium umoris]